MFSDPVVGNDFLGREEILQTLKKRVESFQDGYRQNIALLGRPFLGKTSVLHHYLTSWHDDQVLPIYVDLKPQALDAFLQQFARAFLYQYLKGRASVGPQECLEVLCERARGEIPRTVKRIQGVQELVKRKDMDAAYGELLEITTHFHRETGRKCLVVFDEFHRLGDFSLKQPFQVFGRRIMVQKDTMYVLLSSSLLLSREILAQKLSLLFGNFECIHLEPFTFETAGEFIQTKLEPVVMPEMLCKYLVAFTDGHPFYLNVICRQLKELAERELKPLGDRRLFVECLKKLLFDSEGILNQHFMNLISRWVDVGSRGSHLAILLHIADGHGKLKDLSEFISRSMRETSRQLNELMEAEQIAKSGVFYYFPNKVFRMWLKCVYRHREISLLVDTPSKAGQFVRECEAGMDEFFEASQEEDAERIARLLKCFSNEMVEFDAKGKRLPAFREVVTVPGSGESARRSIIAKARNIHWICDVSDRRVTEQEVNRFILEAGGAGDKHAKKIMITLRGMDQNARLLAKNTKIWTLNLQKINALMEFYGQSKIVSMHEEPR